MHEFKLQLSVATGGLQGGSWIFSPDLNRSSDGDGNICVTIKWGGRSNFPVLVFDKRHSTIAWTRKMKKLGFLGTKILSWQVWYYGNEANNFLHSVHKDRSTVNKICTGSEVRRQESLGSKPQLPVRSKWRMHQPRQRSQRLVNFSRGKKSASLEMSANSYILKNH